ncbi:conserved domain protein [Turicibacter sanguinis PC909]|uniref:Conserved domain protein n=1 Tax=Turicibacter sanguinis PC909 TaxID=702450 RepID=A0ABN0A4G4_9FIRM|nr:conserved domain protein [Turicibacter sanguinis PC909]EGC92586.1 hypothetical protein HMPREF9402_2836 [Turicibacter sp. HGF1]
MIYLKKNQDCFIKLKGSLKNQKKDVEMAQELDAITKLEISRIKTKVRRKWLTNNHSS